MMKIVKDTATTDAALRTLFTSVPAFSTTLFTTLLHFFNQNPPSVTPEHAAHFQE